jgi:hypothetical protein
MVDRWEKYGFFELGTWQVISTTRCLKCIYRVHTVKRCMDCSMQISDQPTFILTWKTHEILLKFCEQMESVFLLLILCCLFSLLVISSLQVMYQWGWLYINIYIYIILITVYDSKQMIMLLILWALMWRRATSAPSLEWVCACVCGGDLCRVKARPTNVHIQLFSHLEVDERKT